MYLHYVTVLANNVVSRNVVNKSILIICWHIHKEFTYKSIFTEILELPSSNPKRETKSHV